MPIALSADYDAARLRAAARGSKHEEHFHIQSLPRHSINRTSRKIWCGHSAGSPYTAIPRVIAVLQSIKTGRKLSRTQRATADL